MKLRRYSASDVIVLSSNPSAGSLSRIKRSVFILSATVEELLSIQKIIISSPKLK